MVEAKPTVSRVLPNSLGLIFGGIAIYEGFHGNLWGMLTFVMLQMTGMVIAFRPPPIRPGFCPICKSPLEAEDREGCEECGYEVREVRNEWRVIYFVAAAQVACGVGVLYFKPVFGLTVLLSGVVTVIAIRLTA